jgi:ribose 5-phosphate isomerase B
VRIAIGADHAGFQLKEMLAAYLRDRGEHVVDVGTYSAAPVDYPDYAEAIGNALREGRADRAILICGSGVGASVAANKLLGIRAGLCHDTYSAHQGVEHDDMNVLVLGARVIGPELARELVHTFLQATFSGEERHRRRLAKVMALERHSAG